MGWGVLARTCNPLRQQPSALQSFEGVDTVVLSIGSVTCVSHLVSVWLHPVGDGVDRRDGVLCW
jgi:hypothetical protein